MSEYRFKRWSTLRQITYIICMIVVFSYILFDVLDLDGSDFPPPRAPVERTIIVAEVPKDIKVASLPDRTELWGDLIGILQDGPGKSLPDVALATVRHLPLASARARGYRVALPRSSPSSSPTDSL